MIVGSNHIFSNNALTRVYFDFNNNVTNKAKKPLVGEWYVNFSPAYNNQMVIDNKKFGTHSFRATSRYARYDFTAEVNTQNCYYSIWFYIASNPTTATGLLHIINEDSKTISVQINTSGLLSIEVKSFDSVISLSDTIQIPLGSWAQFKMYVAKTVIKFSINATLKSCNINAPISTVISRIYVPTSINDLNNRFLGYVDEFIIRTTDVPVANLTLNQNREI